MEIETIESPWVLFLACEWKGHWVSKELFAGLAEDARRRCHEYWGFKAAESGMIDLPGMCAMDRTYQEYNLDGFKLSIPTTDFEYFLKAVRTNPLRTFSNGQEYYKLHGWIHCIVLSVPQRNALLALMEGREPEVMAQCKAEDAELTRRIREINKDDVKVISPRDPKTVQKKLVSKPDNNKN